MKILIYYQHRRLPLTYRGLTQVGKVHLNFELKTNIKNTD